MDNKPINLDTLIAELKYRVQFELDNVLISTIEQREHLKELLDSCNDYLCRPL